MTTPNIDELIDRLYDWHNTSAEQNRLDMQKAADLLQSQAERIAELEAEIDNIKAVEFPRRLDKVTQPIIAERDTLRAQLAEIAATEPVYYEFQWTNPGNQPYQPESMFVWARVEPAWNGTVQQKVDELLAYRYDDKPTYRVRALFTHPMPAQGVETDMINLPEPVAWFANYGGNVYTEAQLKQAVSDALDVNAELVGALQLFAYALPLDKSTVKTCYAVTNQMRDAAHAALSKYKGAK